MCRAGPHNCREVQLKPHLQIPACGAQRVPNAECGTLHIVAVLYKGAVALSARTPVFGLEQSREQNALSSLAWAFTGVVLQTAVCPVADIAAGMLACRTSTRRSGRVPAQPKRFFANSSAAFSNSGTVYFLKVAGAHDVRSKYFSANDTQQMPAAQVVRQSHFVPSEKGLMLSKLDQLGSARVCCRVVKRKPLPSTLLSTMPPGSTGATGGTILQMPVHATS